MCFLRDEFNTVTLGGEVTVCLCIRAIRGTT